MKQIIFTLFIIVNILVILPIILRAIQTKELSEYDYKDIKEKKNKKWYIVFLSLCIIRNSIALYIKILRKFFCRMGKLVILVPVFILGFYLLSYNFLDINFIDKLASYDYIKLLSSVEEKREMIKTFIELSKTMFLSIFTLDLLIQVVRCAFFSDGLSQECVNIMVVSSKKEFSNDKEIIDITILYKEATEAVFLKYI